MRALERRLGLAPLRDRSTHRRVSRADMVGADRPYLSIVVTGRNDDFGGDFNGRFFRALRFNHDQLTRAGVTHEFVFVEWRPIEGRPYLATVTGAEFPDLRPAQLQCYVVDPAYHDALNLNPRLQFQEFIAKNVGIRRATGQFVLTTNTDIYLGRGVIESSRGAGARARHPLSRRSARPEVIRRRQPRRLGRPRGRSQLGHGQPHQAAVLHERVRRLPAPRSGDATTICAVSTRCTASQRFTSTATSV